MSTSAGMVIRSFGMMTSVAKDPAELLWLEWVGDGALEEEWEMDQEWQTVGMVSGVGHACLCFEALLMRQSCSRLAWRYPRSAWRSDLKAASYAAASFRAWAS